MSHPSRVRGLKCTVARTLSLSARSSHPSRVRGLKLVLGIPGMAKVKSHPSRVRGLKFISKTWMQDLSEVAPFTGAWIEMIDSIFRKRSLVWSHPSRVRGLKSSRIISQRFRSRRSHPSRVRGLKSYFGGNPYPFKFVAPFTGAWIEIFHLSLSP